MALEIGADRRQDVERPLETILLRNLEALKVPGGDAVAERRVTVEEAG